LFNPQPVPAADAPARGSGVVRALAEIVQTVLIAGALFLLVNLLTARIRVEGNSMEPSLHDGEFVVVNRLAYRWNPPERGDIVVFRFPLNPTRRFIKRIIALPGDIVQVSDGQVFVNGLALVEPYTAAAPRYTGEWRMAEGEVFVLGDNRNNSEDSHEWGPLPTQNIIGKAVLVYWPVGEIGILPHAGSASAAGD
jgi:signal peptidase I